MVMRATWSEPYLWVHLAGLAAVPIFLELCLLGLAASTAHLPAQLVLLLVAAAGIAPIVWMQWQRPFSIFSLLLLAVKPKDLTEFQRQVLRRFTAPIGKVATVLTAVLAAVLLWQIGAWVPLVNPVRVALVPGGALGGLLLAMGAFLLTNLFLQVPASVLTVMLTPDVLVRNAVPYPVEKIAQDFTLIGVPVQQILPRLVTESVSLSTSHSAPSPPPKSRSESWDEAMAFEQDQTTGQIDAVSVDEAETIADVPLTVVEPDPATTPGADEEGWIESSADALNQPESDLMDAEFTEVAPDATDAPEADWTNSTGDAADLIAAETEAMEESVNPFAIDLPEAELTESVKPTQEELAAIEFAESLTSESFTRNSGTQGGQPAPNYADANGRTEPGREAISTVVPFRNEISAVQLGSSASSSTVAGPNAADTVVTIVVTGSNPTAPELAPAESTEPVAHRLALTVSEVVVKIVLS